MTTAKTKPPGRWKKGESGNPAGRTPGTGEVARLRAVIADRVPELLNNLMEQALAGDTSAARLLLERAIAPLKAIEPAQAVDIGGDTLSDKAHAVLASVAAGELAVSQGAALLGAIGTMARISEIDELAQRITKLENRKNGNA